MIEYDNNGVARYWRIMKMARGADSPDSQYEWSIINAAPVAEGFIPIIAPEKLSTGTSTNVILQTAGVPCGGFTAKVMPTGATEKVYSEEYWATGGGGATDGKIFRYTNNQSAPYSIDDVSGTAMEATRTNVQDGEYCWQFVQFGNKIIGVNGNTDPGGAGAPNKPLAKTVGTSSAFNLLAGTPPAARTITTYRDFVVLACTRDTVASTVHPTRVHWSALGNSEYWTPDPARQCDFQDLEEAVVEIVYLSKTNPVLIICRKAIYRMTYVGPPVIMQFELLHSGVGARCTAGCVTVNNWVYFASYEGLYRASVSGELEKISNDLGSGVRGLDLVIDSSKRVSAAHLSDKGAVMWINADTAQGVLYFYEYKQFTYLSLLKDSAAGASHKPGGVFASEPADSIFAYTSTFVQPSRLASGYNSSGMDEAPMILNDSGTASDYGIWSMHATVSQASYLQSSFVSPSFQPARNRYGWIWEMQLDGLNMGQNGVNELNYAAVGTRNNQLLSAPMTGGGFSTTGPITISTANNLMYALPSQKTSGLIDGAVGISITQPYPYMQIVMNMKWNLEHPLRGVFFRRVSAGGKY